MTDSWLEPPEETHLDKGEVHLWRISLTGNTQEIEGLSSIISLEEKDQAKRFISESAYIGFIVGRGCIRKILGGYLKINPANIQFKYSTTGKPELSSDFYDPNLQFNYSQSGNYGLLGVTDQRCIGVDIEKIREDIDFQPVAERFFTSDEVSYLTQLAEDSQRVGFFRMWTAKEAYLKATGIGLSRSFSQLDIQLLESENSDIYSFLRPSDHTNWTIKWVSTYPGYISAVAVPGDIAQIKLFQCMDF